MKVHTVMNYLEGVPMVVQLSSPAKHDHYLLKKVHLPKNPTSAMDRGYIDISQFQRLTEEGVCYVTKMKKNLKYEVIDSVTYVNPMGLVTHIDQKVRFTRGELTNETRRVEIFDEKKKTVVLLTYNFKFSLKDVSEIYRLRWAIEELIQTVKTDLPAAFLLWRQCQCHTNPNVGGADCQSTPYSSVKKNQTTLCFLSSRDHGSSDAHVLHRFDEKSRPHLGGCDS